MHEREIETCNTFQTPNGAETYFPPAATTINGGAGLTAAQHTAAVTVSPLADAKEVVVYGYFVTSTGTSIQFNVGTTPVAIVGMLFATTSVGLVTFPCPVRIRPDVATETASLSVTTVGATCNVTIFYRKLA